MYKNNEGKPLTVYHRILLETILQFSPLSVFGSWLRVWDHLHNLQVLSPQIHLHGIDISEEQIKI